MECSFLSSSDAVWLFRRMRQGDRVAKKEFCDRSFAEIAWICSREARRLLPSSVFGGDSDATHGLVSAGDLTSQTWVILLMPSPMIEPDFNLISLIIQVARNASRMVASGMARRATRSGGESLHQGNDALTASLELAPQGELADAQRNFEAVELVRHMRTAASNPELGELGEALDAVALGDTIQEAADRVGVHRSTLSRRLDAFLRPFRAAA